jgi:LemA protein
MTTAIVISALVVSAAVIWLAVTWNRLVKARNAVHHATGQIDVQLRRRHDLIPPLVEAVKGAMAHERDTIDAVTRARSLAVRTQEAALGDRPGTAPATGAGGLAEVAGAENQLTQALGQLMARAEAYPELKTSDNVLQLGEELTTTENRVAYARQAYNDAVLTYNTRRAVFPTTLLAGPMGFRPAEMWEADFVELRSVPGVSF